GTNPVTPGSHPAMQKDHRTAAPEYLVMHNGAIKENCAQSLFPKLHKNIFHAVRQLIRSEGLEQILFCASLESLLNLTFLSSCGKKNDRNILELRVRFHCLAGFIACHTRHTDIHD